MITLAFLFLFCICILCCFLTQKAPFRMLFLVSLDSVRCYFWCFADPPVLLDGGSSSGGGQICQNAEIPPSFMSLPCIFCKRMHLQYIEAFLVSTPWGFAPNPSLTCGAAGQAVKTQPPDPVAKCWVGSKASRVKCGFAALDPSPPP